MQLDGTLSPRDTHSVTLIFSQEVSDLQEQLADLMRHLETQQAIASASDETRQVINMHLFSYFPLLSFPSVVNKAVFNCI